MGVRIRPLVRICHYDPPRTPLVLELSADGLKFQAREPRLDLVVELWEALVPLLASETIGIASVIGKTEARRRQMEAAAALQVRLRTMRGLV